MSWLKKVLGGRSASEWLSEAKAKEDSGELGEAKLAYDRALERAKEDATLRDQAEQGAARCCDGLALARLAHAEELVQAGNLELAREELANAFDTARGSATRQKIREASHLLERRDAVEAAEAPAPITAEERLALIAGNWGSLQAEELESYGEPLMQGLVWLDEGHAERARDALLACVEQAPDPRYLWLEVGRAHLACEQLDDAEQALRTFLSQIGPDEGGEARLLAHNELARLAHDRGDTEAAVRELESCAEALEDDPRPYLQLGVYLRISKRAEEAVEVLQMCADMFPEGQIEWPVLTELGLAHADAGQDAQAVSVLEGVVELLSSQGHLDFPPALATTLAELHERGGNLARAADLYRGLAEGSHVAQHAHYHRQAARLLEALGLTEEASRMQQRAEAIESHSESGNPVQEP